MRTNTDQRRIVLLGIGHTNASIVHRWASDPLPDTELVCISNYPFSTYSGMLPGTLAGQYSPDEMQIDLLPLVEKANGKLLLAEVNRVDPVSQTLFFQDHAPLNFDALSVGIGSVPVGLPQSTDLLVPIKPMQTFLDRLELRIDQLVGRPDCTPKICIVGGGVAGVEISLCLHTALSKHIDPKRFSIQIFTGSNQIADGLSARGVKRLDRILEDRNIHVSRNMRVTACDNQNITTDDGKLHRAACVVWTTGASAPSLLGCFNLPTDDRGFILTDSTLKTVAGYPVFAVGDSGSLVESPTPKAGVFAVRQAPILWHNLKAMLTGQPLRPFIPQTDFLKILNTGDNAALLEYKGFSVQARWCMKLKTVIDKRFIAPYQAPSEDTKK